MKRVFATMQLCNSQSVALEATKSQLENFEAHWIMYPLSSFTSNEVSQYNLNFSSLFYPTTKKCQQVTASVGWYTSEMFYTVINNFCPLCDMAHSQDWSQPSLWLNAKRISHRNMVLLTTNRFGEYAGLAISAHC